jgi:hypothetical protein
MSTIDPLQALLQPIPLKATLFPPNSRYHGIDIATIVREDGRTVAYVRRRIVPPPERFALLQEHIVTAGERLDTITAHYFADPELFWRVCDANRALRPEALTETPGRRLRITLPEGIQGAPGA